MDLISPSPAPVDGPSRRQARKHKRRAAERRAQQQERLEAAGLPPAAATALNSSDAARSRDAAGAEKTNGHPAAGNGAFAGVPALVASFMTQQGFDAPTEIQSRCAGGELIKDCKSGRRSSCA